MQVREGSQKFEIPTCLPVGEVNVYLLEDPHLTLIDTRPNAPESYDVLVKELRRSGYSIRDIGRILITRGHVDHYGLANTVRRESMAEVFAPESDVAIVKDFKNAYEQKRKNYMEVLLETGIPLETPGLAEGFFEYLTSLAEATQIAALIRDGDLIDVGSCQLRAIHSPGHSPGSTCFLDPEGYLISGDTLMRDTIPVAAFGSAEGKSIGLADYLASVNRLEKLKTRCVMPGHRSDIKDLPAHASLIRFQFESRQASVLRLIQKEGKTAYDLVHHLFGSLAIQNIFPALTEILGHLEILAAEGRVKCEEKSGLDYYSLE